MHKVHSFLVTAYLIGGLAMMASTPWSAVTGMLAERPVNIAMDNATNLADAAILEAAQADASRHLLFGILLFVLGGFMHAYGRLRSERPVHITVKKKKPLTLFWYQLRL